MGMIIIDKQEDTVDIVFNDKVDYVSHGTGDVFASSFVGSTMLGKTPSSAAKVVKFEQAIPELYDLLKTI